MRTLIFLLCFSFGWAIAPHRQDTKLRGREAMQTRAYEMARQYCRFDKPACLAITEAIQAEFKAERAKETHEAWCGKEIK